MPKTLLLLGFGATVESRGAREERRQGRAGLVRDRASEPSLEDKLEGCAKPGQSGLRSG